MTDNEIYTLMSKMITANRMHRKAIEGIIDDVGIHRTQHQILMNLSKKERFSSQKAIAEHLGITQAAVTGALAKLERDGYIGRESGSDTRFNEIFITEKGRELIERSKSYFISVDRIALDGIEADAFEIMQVCFDRISNNLKEFIEREQAK